MDDDIFIFTEIVNCGKIGFHALKSFTKYHPGIPVHVYGRSYDLKEIKEFPHLVLHRLDTWGLNTAKIIPDRILTLFVAATGRIADINIIRGYSSGHLGTARLWAKIIRERPERYILHFDSDIIFRGEVVSEFTKKIRQGYDLIGRHRNYRYNPNNRQDVRHLPDACQTLLFAFNREKISHFPPLQLIRMCQGVENPLGFPVIDFFDPVMFDIRKNGGKVYFLSSDKFGGCDAKGSRNNRFAQINRIIDFGSKIAHFSAVGSGMNFCQNSDSARNVPASYVAYAKEKYALFMKIFYNAEIEELPEDKYASLFSVKQWY